MGLLLIGALILSYLKVRRKPFRTPLEKGEKWSFTLKIFLMGVFGLYNVLAISGLWTEEEAIELEFPLKDGVYYIGIPIEFNDRFLVRNDLVW